MTTPTNQGKFNRWVKTSITLRMFMIGFLLLLLLIPLFFIQNLINERMDRQEEVVKEINKKWGEEVLLYGPILKIPYIETKKSQVFDKQQKKYFTEIEKITHHAYFFPHDLNVQANINPKEKKRGIYTTAVYNGNIEISGSFSSPNLSALELDEKDLLWNKAKIIVQTSNLKGVTESIQIKWDGEEHPLTAMYESSDEYNYAEKTGRYSQYNTLSLHRLESNFLTTKTGENHTFSLHLQVNGSKQVRLLPIGKTTTTEITSDWKTANFVGEYLPYNEDKITATGFDAKWKILEVNRPFPQYYKDEIPNLKDYAFGVNFMIPVDEYTKSDRSTKYGFLVIGLTFLAFFLIQTLSKINIHPFQYLLIGIALVMFYTLLISISEHSSFLKAYVIASVSVIGLITLYSRSILKGVKFPLFIGLSLSALYGFIFVIIQLENYALLVGCIGLFVILALVMFVSRKIDWQNNEVA